MAVSSHHASRPTTPAEQSRGRSLKMDDQKRSKERSASSSSSASSTGHTQASTPPPREAPQHFPMTHQAAWALVDAICSDPQKNPSTAQQTLARAAKAGGRFAGIRLDQVANLLMADVSFATANYAPGCHWKISTFRVLEGQLIQTASLGCSHATSTSQAAAQFGQ